MYWLKIMLCTFKNCNEYFSCESTNDTIIDIALKKWFTTEYADWWK